MNPAAQRVQLALELIESAQRELEAACEQLSPVRGGVAQWEATSHLVEQVDQHWHALEVWLRERGDLLTLDQLTRDSMRPE